jgi:general nucleoside transport system permease protein
MPRYRRLRTIRTSALSLLAALCIGGVLAALLGYPVVNGYRNLLRYSLGSQAKFGLTLSNAVPLVLTGLSAAIAFASGPINLGQPGQVLMGALAATLGGLYVHLPSFIEIPLLLFLAACAGAAWSGIAALARRRFGMDEFIVTLMLNEIARLFTDWAISSPLQDRDAGSVTTKAIARSGWLPKFGSISSSVIVGLLAVVVTVIVSTRFVVGYEWRMAGQAPLFARLGGVNVERNITSVMLTTGSLAGLAGGVLLMAGPHKFGKGLGGNYGWDGVTIAVVAANVLVGVAAYGLLFSILQTGAIGMEIRSNIPQEFIQMLQAVIVLTTVAARGLLGSTLAAWSAKRIAKQRAGQRPSQGDPNTSHERVASHTPPS